METPVFTEELEPLLEEIRTMEDFLLTHGVTKMHIAEAELRQNFPEVQCPLIHRFTPGMYIREIFMPKGSMVISRRHLTEHPFIISLGDVSVWIEGQGVVRLKAPHTGITKPGTQRILYMHENTAWVTFHLNPDDGQDVSAISDRILEPNLNPLSL